MVKLLCPACGAEYSANPRDYFWAYPGHRFPCGACNNEAYCALVRVTTHTTGLHVTTIQHPIALEATIEDLQEEASR